LLNVLSSKNDFVTDLLFCIDSPKEV